MAFKTRSLLKSKKCKGYFVVQNEKGLHTRPSTELVRLASSFKSRINLSCNEHVVNAKSILGILMLAAAKGTNIAIEAEGADAKDAIEAIQSLATDQFNIRY